LALFVQEPRLGRASSLRKVICGGESLASELVQRFYERVPGADLHHSYGPTETSIAAAEIVCPREPQWPVMPIGRPLGNNQLYILDRQMEPVPTGVTGELYVGGEGLARGYLGRAGLTAGKFILDPFSSEPGARLYRTGDLARYLPDALIEFRGRADSQVKLRGMRVELGEIEAALREHSHVRDCAAVLQGDGIDASVVAYVVTADQPTQDLREYLRGKLPRHMLPSAFVQLERLPLMLNGKLDRRALPSPNGHQHSSQTEFVAPHNEVERTVAEIWAEVLGVEHVGIHDNFFDLGGHSLRLLQVHLRLREALHRELPLFELFQYPTVSSLASHLQTGGDGDSLASSEERGERRKQRSEQQRQRRQTAKAAHKHDKLLKR
jgi:acyl carrier protein